MRSKMLKIRVTEEECNQVLKKSKQAKRSVSEFIRMRLALDCEPIRIPDAADDRREQYMSALCQIAEDLNELTIASRRGENIDMAALASIAQFARSLES